jgi:hypothetical protein
MHNSYVAVKTANAGRGGNAGSWYKITAGCTLAVGNGQYTEQQQQVLQEPPLQSPYLCEEGAFGLGQVIRIADASHEATAPVARTADPLNGQQA